MNTPAHAVMNLAVIGPKERAGALSTLAGAITPDLPMFVFYAWQKLVVGASETQIWGEIFFRDRWQDFFDLFNSVPLGLVGLGAAWWAGSRNARLFFGSMLLHAALDMPLHHDDGHRHLFPLSDWRFASPVSYWDPAHYGWIVAPLEIVGVLAACAVICRRYQSRSAYAGSALVVASYAVLYLFVVLFWM